MRQYGRRFLAIQNFISHASALKVGHLNEKELEFYERHQLLLPVACTRMPTPHAIALAEKSRRVPLSNLDDLEPPDEWRRLDVFPVLPEDGIHPFDREQERDNPCLVIPDCTTFRPWDSDRIPVNLPDGDAMYQNTVERYYASWQVHVVEQLRQRRYYERAPFLRELPESHDFREFYRLPDDTERFRTLNGMAVGYNALTLYGFAKQAAYQEAFLSVPTGQMLSESAHNKLQELLTQRTQRALCASGIDESSFFKFVHELTQLIEEHRSNERISLAEDAEQYLWDAVRFADYGFGHEGDGFLAAAERHVGENLANTLRRLDPVETTVQEAQRNLTYILQDSIGARNPLDASDLSDIPQEIVEFCLEHDLYEVLTGLQNYSYTGTERQHDRYPGFFHRRLRPLALAVEQLVRGILDATQEPHHGKSLAKLIEAIGQKSCWLAQFQSLISEGATSDKDKEKPLDQKVLMLAQSIQTSDCKDHDFIAKTLVIAVAARNLVTHRHKFLSYDMTTNLAGACADSVVFIWLQAKERGFV
ncbi:MAG: hypothetical protein OXI96_08325 [Acidimicrobiaceae bacterium]|nr:hypothetical protein [Acidimicrobiaceae bacterium]